MARCRYAWGMAVRVKRGDMPSVLNGRVDIGNALVALVPAPDGHCYWLVAFDGGVFTFGDAGFYGSVPGSYRGTPEGNVMSQSRGPMPSQNGQSALGTLSPLSGPDHPEAPRKAPYRVLLVDDVQEERELLGTWLEETSRFVVVGEARDGPRGVVLAGELLPDLVTLDMSMPGGDGYAALRKIQSASPDSTIVVVSGFVSDELAHAIVDTLGASACLDKSIGLDRLVEELLKAVERPITVLDLAGDDGRQAVIDREFVTNARLAAIVKSSDDAIIGKTLDGTVTSWNAGAERLYGYTETEMVGQNIALLIPSHCVDELSDILKRVGQGEPVEHHETQRVRKDQFVVDVSLAVSPIRDRTGVVVGAATIARDLTDHRKVVIAELARQADELRRSNDELEQFAYVASHDLSEPLRTISGYVELLSRRYGGQLDDDADRFIKHTVDGCDRMRHLIDDLLTYSRAGQTANLTGTIDCASLVRDVVASMSTSLTETNGQVDYDGLPTVRGDQAQLLQLFQNLIANALKFSRPGIPPRVHIEAHQLDSTWTFSVADNGIGIEPEYRDQIFGMFQRLHARDAYPGTGIGLAICMRIVRTHGGQIWVEDKNEAGSCFMFTLPDVDKEQL
jgi:PAS domain S-box-containing protein